MKRKDIPLILLVVVGSFFAFSTFLAFWPSRVKLQVSHSPSGSHTAELSRTDHLDRNYTVTLDGTVVYRSPDFSPRGDIPYYEALIWDTTGQVVVLEIARQRVFGYDTKKGQQLSDEELLNVDLLPDPPLWEYHFESEWPGIGRAKRPESSEQ